MKTTLLAIAAIFLFGLSQAQPVITSNPQNTTNCSDSCVWLRVAANGVGLTYHWQADEGSGFSYLSTPSATNDTLTVCDNGSAAPSTIDYRCVVTDMNGYRDTSLVATITLDSCLAPTADFDITFSSATERCFTNTSRNANSISWTFGTGATSTAQSPCLDYDTLWVFDVTLYAFNDYGSDQKTFTLDLLATEEVQSEKETRVYPNPTRNILYVETEGKLELAQIFDLNGRLVMETSSTQNLISLQNLDAGVYSLVLHTGGKVDHHKIVKQ